MKERHAETGRLNQHRGVLSCSNTRRLLGDRVELHAVWVMHRAGALDPKTLSAAAGLLEGAEHVGVFRP